MNNELSVSGRILLPRMASIRLDAGGDGPTRPVELADTKLKTRGVLILTGGWEAGRLYHLDGDSTTLGRGKGCTIQFNDTSLSRTHARITRKGARYVLEDAGSLNGSYLNGQRVRFAELVDGNRIRLGTGVSLRFQIMDEDEEAALVRTYESSIRDGLTGTFNRKQLEERLGAEVSYALRHGTALSAIVIDLDRFKHINDTYGHLAGDAVLKAVATVLMEGVRREDFLGRYGGEEFVVIVRGTPVEGAVAVGERLRRAIEAMRVPFASGVLQVTASIGVASLECCAPPRSVTSLFRRADECLYRAKALGRNRVVAD